MNNIILKLNNCVKEILNYKTINKMLKDFNYEHQIRNKLNGLSLYNILNYEANYSLINTKKENITSLLNIDNDNNVNRTSYYRKEKNIPYQFYDKLKQNISNICYDYVKEINGKNIKCIALDGTNTNDIKQNVSLNMGYYDFTNNIVLDLTYNGIENRNKEVSNAINYIKNNINEFKDAIIVGDRFYFSYEFIEFLLNNEIKFIIRCKGKGTNLDINTKLKKTKQTNLIEKIRTQIRVVKYDEPYIKTIDIRKTKKNEKQKKIIKIFNDCILVTNIINKDNNEILNLYKKRWDIEVFFKIIKNNFKIQHTNEKDNTQVKKIYSFMMITMNLLTLIETNYFNINKINKPNYTVKVNKSLLIDGIIKFILPKLFKFTLTYDNILNLQKNYIKVIKNKNDRHFERYSAEPFSKWNIKSYSINSEIKKIIEAIETKTTDNLNKNLRCKAHKIIEIIK